MKGKSCKLYDEELVHNIMISTGLSIVEYIKQFKNVDAVDICDFVEQNADKIIENTIDDMNHEFPDNEKGHEPPAEEGGSEENPFP